jgi:hypothetical protein
MEDCITHRVLGREVAQRHEEAAHPVDEEVDRSRGGDARTVAHDDRRADAPRHLDHGEESRVPADRADPGIAVQGVHLVEVGAVALLAREELHHLHPGDRLLDHRVDPGDANAGLAEGLADLQPEDDRDDHEERNHREAEEREPPVDQEERRRKAKHHQDVGDERHDPRGEHLHQVLDVVGGAGHQASHRVAIEETQVQLLDVAEDVPAQIAHGELARTRHDVEVHELKPGHEHGGDEVENAQPQELRERARRSQNRGEPGGLDRRSLAPDPRHDHRIEPVLDDPRGGEVKDEERCHQREGDRHEPPVGEHVGPEAGQELRVVGLPQLVLFVDQIQRRRAHATASSSSSSSACCRASRA